MIFLMHLFEKVYLSIFLNVFCVYIKAFKKNHLAKVFIAHIVHIAKVFKNFLPQCFLDKLYFLACMYTKAIAELDRGKSHKIQGFVLAENFVLLILIKSFSSVNRESVY